MIIELKDQTMTDLILFKHIHIKSQKPNIQYKDGQTTPSWKISSKCSTSIFNTKVLIVDDEDKSGQ
jgi:hypothetical protein